MKKKIGPMIRNAREQKGVTRKQAARILGITEGYLSHLERSAPVHLSDNLILRLILSMGVSMDIKLLQASHNKLRVAAERRRARSKRELLK